MNTNMLARSSNTLSMSKSDISVSKKKNLALPLFAIFLFSAYLLPFHFLPFSPFYNDWLAIFGVVIVAAYLASESSIIYVPWISVLPFGIAGVIMIQALLGMLTAAADAVLPVAYFIVAALAMVIGANFAAAKEGTTKLCMALTTAHLAAGLLSVGIACLQFMNAEAILDPFVMVMLHEGDKVIRPIANIAQPNQLALLFCIAIASVWWMYQANRLQEGIALATVLALLWGLVLTQSRIGWLIIPFFAAFAWVPDNKSNLKKVPQKVLVGLVLLYGALVASLPAITAMLLDTETVSAIKRVEGQSERLLLWQQALHISLSYPWFGAGWHEFGPQQLKIANEFVPVAYSQHSHNIMMNFAAEMGWPLTILIFGALSYWFVTSCFRRPASKEVRFATLVFMAVLVHSLVEFPLWYAYVLMPLALLIGMVHQEQFGSREVRLPRFFAVSFVFVLLIGAIGAAMDYRRLAASMWVTGWASLGVKTEIWSIEKPAFTIFPHFYDYFLAKTIPIRTGMPAEEIALMERVTKRFGYIDILERTALVYALNNRADDAIKTLASISKLHKNTYPDICKTWEKLAKREPEKFLHIFKQMPKPDLAN